jgi:hypothetical protein
MSWGSQSRVEVDVEVMDRRESEGGQQGDWRTSWRLDAISAYKTSALLRFGRDEGVLDIHMLLNDSA